MREILFKGKRKDNGEWVEGRLFADDVIVPCGQNFILEANCLYEGDKPIIGYYVDEETVGQFTGLTDKSGKKIFEGDIVKCKHTIRLSETKEEILRIKKPRRTYGLQAVEIDFQPFSLGNECNLYDVIYYRNYIVKSDIKAQRTKLQNGSDFHFLTASYVNYHDIEIIGNIHDNPELLKVE